MNHNGILVSRDHLLKKCLGNCAGDVHAVERCEVVVCGEKPMRLKYHPSQHKFCQSTFIMVIGINLAFHNTNNYYVLLINISNLHGAFVLESSNYLLVLMNTPAVPISIMQWIK